MEHAGEKQGAERKADWLGPPKSPLEAGLWMCSWALIVLCGTFPFVLTHTLPRGLTLLWADTVTGCHPLLSREGKAIGDHAPLAFQLCRMAGQGLMTMGVPRDCPCSIPTLPRDGLWCLHGLIIMVDSWLQS